MNETIFYFFYNFAHQSVSLDWLIVFCAQTFPYIVIMLAGIFLLFHHEIFRAQNPFQVLMQKYREILIVFFSAGIAVVLAKLFKLLFHTIRPFELLPQVQSLFFESDYAFPSGHATFFMALAFAIYFSHKKIGYVFMFLALIIGLARVVAGVHFPIDILGGFLLGIGTAYLVRHLSFRFAYFQGKIN